MGPFASMHLTDDGRRINASFLAVILQLLCLFIHVFSTAAFTTSSTSTFIQKSLTPPRATSLVRLVTEEDVLDAVEKAENSWAAAFAAREKAKELSEQAEEASCEAARDSEEVASAPKSMTSQGGISRVADVLQSTLDAGDLVAEAKRASDEADRLEAMADKVLAESEEKLNQHLKDFPDSPLH